MQFPLKHFFLLSVLFCFPVLYCEAQIDSLKNLLSSAPEDSNKVKILYKLCGEYSEINYSISVDYGKQALILSYQLKYKKGEALSLYFLAGTYNYYHSTNRAIESFRESINIFKILNDVLGMAACYGDIAKIYERQDDYKNAIDNYLKSLNFYEEINNKEGTTFCLNQLGNLYYNLGNYQKSIEYRKKCLALDEKEGSKEDIATSLNNLGTAYYKLNRLDTAYDLHNSSLKIKIELGDSAGIASSLGNIGNIYLEQGKFDKALDFHNQSLRLFILLKQNQNIAICYVSIADVYLKKKMFTEAADYAMRGLKVARVSNLKSDVKNTYKTLSEIYATQGNFENAYKYQHLYNEMKDSLISEDGNRLIAEMQTNFETEKKEKEIELLNKDKEIQSEVSRKQKIAIYSAVGGLILVLALAFFIFRSYKEKQKANLLLERKNIAISLQKEEIEKQKSVIEEAHIIVQKKNVEITDSINYARRIQEAILPSDEYLEKCFSEYFVLFKPKDIVSGDFYWAYQSPNNKLIWAAVDCTGHGVPGAFMSMIGNSLLNEIVIENGIEESDMILNHLREAVIKALKQTGEANKQKDGMDIALCVLDKSTNKLQFSGANNPLLVIRQGEIIIHKPDKQPIGYYSEQVKPFTKQEIQLQKNDSIYTYTDGYEDQFGGPLRKKFMAKRFKELLLSVQSKSLQEQKLILSRTMDEWKANEEQIDDICVIGVKL